MELGAGRKDIPHQKKCIASRETGSKQIGHSAFMMLSQAGSNGWKWEVERTRRFLIDLT